MASNRSVCVIIIALTPVLSVRDPRFQWRADLAFACAASGGDVAYRAGVDEAHEQNWVTYSRHATVPCRCFLILYG